MYQTVRVRSVLPDTAAARTGGVLPGDAVLTLDGHKVAGMAVAEVSRRLLGEEGSLCTIDVSPHVISLSISLCISLCENLCVSLSFCISLYSNRVVSLSPCIFMYNYLSASVSVCVSV